MKKTITILATVAFTCCGLQSSFGQIQINTGSPTPAPRLVSNQTELGEVSAPAREALGNPFDLFSEQDESALLEPAELPATAPVENDRSSYFQEDSSPSDADPKSLPVGRHHRRHSVVDTVIDHATIASVPNAAMGPVFWNQTARTPNPVADILLREECNVRALWAGYPAEHAAECAKMWNCINGHHAHSCTQCASPATNCDVCQPVRNRYRQPHFGGRTAAACDAPACATSACDAGQMSPAAPCASCTGVSAELPPATQASDGARNNVAFLPLPAMR
ncbi:MAG: hypothetical protein R3C53_02420 [Pirellulaceae bacterium]